MRRLVSPVLVARADELALLAAAAARAAEGTPAAVLIGGEAGVGKTRLLEEAGARLADDGFVVLHGACVELGGEALPYAPLVDAVRTLSRTLTPERFDEVAGPARPVLDGALDVPPTRLYELSLGMLERLATDRPVALIVEDLHWADEGTRDLVAFLIRALRDARVLVVATYRSDELQRGHPLRHLLAELERVRSVERVELVRFSRDEVREQLTAIRGDAPPGALADLVFDRSEGNAFLVEEMLAIVESGGTEVPPSLRDVLLARLERLSEPTQRMLRAAAVAGGPVSERLLTAVTGLDETELLASLREAVEHHLLIVDGDGSSYRFRHALARDAVYEDMLPGERGRLHAAFGGAIDADATLAGTDAVAAALAWHWYAALDLPRALAASVRAARDAARARLPAEAERHSQRALELWDRVSDASSVAGLEHLELLELALESTVAAAHEARALPLAAEALAEADAEREPRRVALVLAQRAEALRRLRRDPMPDLERALDLLGDEPTRELAAVLAGIANAHVLVGADEAARDAGLRAVEIARAVGARDLEAPALLSLGGALGYLGAYDDAVANLRAGLALAREQSDWESCIRAYINLSDALELHGDHRAAAAEAAEGIELAQRVGFAHTLGVFLGGNQAEPLLRLGDYDEAEAILDDALAAGVSSSSVASPILMRAELATARGDRELARELATRARAVLGDDAPHQYEAHLSWIDAELARLDGREADARSAVERGLVDGEQMLGRYSWPLVWLGVRIETHAEAPAAGRLVELERLAGELATSTATARRYRALVAAELARDDADAWRAAADGWREAEEPLHLAYALQRLAESDPEAATAALAESLDLSRRLGAEPLVEAGEALARRERLAIPVGAAGRDAAGDRFGLTDRELDVLRLVAAGRSNAEIGRELYISPKTASVHVSNILGKLGVTRRGEAAATAHRLGLLA